MGAELAILLSARDSASRVLNQVGASAQQLSTHLNQGLGGAIRSLGTIAGTPARALGGLVDVFGRVGLAVFGVKQTIEIFAGALNGLLGEALQAQKGQTQLNAVLASTGGVAGVTAAAANELASSLQKVTTYSDDAVLETENLLLTFTSIGKEVFPQATETVLNMATALGEDTKSAAVQLGKALQDPIKGITALSRVGVNFTAAQKEMIQGMVEAGNVAGAQKLILKELETEFGNSARAAGETFAGKLQILTHQLDDVKQTIGEALLPILTNLLDRLMPLISAFAEALPAALANAEAAFASVWEAVQPFAAGLLDIAETLAGGDFLGAVGKVGDMLNGIVDSISGWVSGEGPGQIRDAMLGLADSAWDWLTTAAESAANVLGGWAESVKAWATGDGLGDIADALVGLAGSAWSWLKVAAEQAGEYLSGLVADVIAWVDGPGLAQMSNAFQGLSGAVWSWLGVAGAIVGGPLGILVGIVIDWVNGQGIRDIGNALSGLAPAAWDWIKGAGATAFDALKGLADYVKAWADGPGPGWLRNALVGLARAAWDWVRTAGETAANALGGLVNSVQAWVTGGGLANVVTALEGLAKGAWDWVLKAKDFAIEKLGGLADGVKAWIDAGGPGVIAAALFGLANVAWDWVQEAVKTAAVKLGPIIQSVRDWVTTSAWPEVQTQGMRLGQALVSGLVGGFTLAIDAGGLQPALDALAARLKAVQVPENVLTGWRSLGDTFRIVSGWVALLTGSGQSGLPALVDGLLAAKKAADDFFAAIGFRIIGGAAEAFKNMALAIEAVISAIDRLVRGKDTFRQAIEDMGTILSATFATAGLFNLGVNIVEGIMDGITSKIDALGGVVKALANQIPQWLKDVLRISSPSQVMYKIGIDIGQGLIDGLGAQKPGVAAATANMMGAMVSVIGSAQQQIRGILAKVTDDYNAIIEMTGGPPIAPFGPTGGPASGLSASGRAGPVPGGSANSGLPWGGEFGYPHPYTGDPRMNPPGFVPAPLQSHPVAHFYGNNFFNGPSMLDALNELGQMVG